MKNVKLTKINKQTLRTTMITIKEEVIEAEVEEVEVEVDTTIRMKGIVNRIISKKKANKIDRIRREQLQCDHKQQQRVNLP